MIKRSKSRGAIDLGFSEIEEQNLTFLVSHTQNITASQDGLSSMRVVNNRAEQYQTLNLTSSSSKSSKKTKTVLTELFVATSIGDAPAVDFYLRIVGIAVDASDVRGWRPIHHAALHGQTKVVELLIRRGANVNCCTVSGITPILLCSSCLTARYDTMRLVENKIYD